MVKTLTFFVCQSCGSQFPKWQGQCSNCFEWNTLVEEQQRANIPHKTATKSFKKNDLSQLVQKLSEVKPLNGQKNRFSTLIGELDRVLGGGMVPGAVVLIGGEPGIGKSTLLTEVVVRLASQAAVRDFSDQRNSSNTSPTQNILYLAGEESPSQIALRINRLQDIEQTTLKKASESNRVKVSGEHISFVTTTDVDEAVEIIHQQRPDLVIIDSIQTLTTSELTGAAGSVGQIREVTDRLTSVAKQCHIPMFLVGHVTKEGTIAGPKVLEHIVDAVIELTGERTSQLRLLRAIKNRFGATDEVGVFQHTERGLEEVTNPSALFLEHSSESVPGSVTVCVMEGSRPLLAEVQSLVVSSQLAMPRRVGRGIELSRIQVLSAVLQKHCRLPISTYDIFVSAAGGFTIREPAVDLGLAVAMASSLADKSVPTKTIFIGEVGLLGEIRAVSYLERRIKEAKRLGFEHIVSRENFSNVAQVLKKYDLLR